MWPREFSVINSVLPSVSTYFPFCPPIPFYNHSRLTNDSNSRSLRFGFWRMQKPNITPYSSSAFKSKSMTHFTTSIGVIPKCPLLPPSHILSNRSIWMISIKAIRILMLIHALISVRLFDSAPSEEAKEKQKPRRSRAIMELVPLKQIPSHLSCPKVKATVSNPQQRSIPRESRSCEKLVGSKCQRSLIAFYTTLWVLTTSSHDTPEMPETDGH